MKTVFISGEDQLKLHLLVWDEVKDPKAVVQLSHGMAEHVLRYGEFAQFLNANGYIVYGHDHRGHGQSVSTSEDLGYFSDADGWLKLVKDLQQVNNQIKKDYPQLPIFLFGHSMGSFAARHYLGLYGANLKGAVICGTGNNPQWLTKTAQLLAKWEMRRKGTHHRSQMLTTLSFGSYNKKFQPNKTEFDWLSSDPIEVYKYIEDPLCGLVFTSSFYNDFLSGIHELTQMSHIEKTPKTMPLLFISGKDDPLSQEGKAIEQVANYYRTAGLTDLTVKVYPGARHELLNETNKQEIYNDVLKWLETHKG